jgi:hypothetical protein
MSLRERSNGLQCQNQACDQQVNDWRASMQSHHPIEYKRIIQIAALLEVSGE